MGKLAAGVAHELGTPLTLRLGHAGGAIPAPVDAEQIEQVLTNLIMNGVQALSGGGELHVASG